MEEKCANCGLIKLLLVLLLTFISNIAFTQVISISAGKIYNDLFPEGHINFRKSEIGLKGGEGYSIQLNIRPTSAKQSLSILLDHYTGKLYPQENYTSVPEVITIDKTTIGMGLYPYDIRVIGDLYIQPGADISVLVSDNTKLGESETFGSTTSKMKYYDDSLNIANNFQFGVSVVIRYQLNLGNYFIAPSYKIYIGGRSEFGKNAELVYSHIGGVYSLRQIVSIGIGRKLYRRKSH